MLWTYYINRQHTELEQIPYTVPYIVPDIVDLL